MRILQLLCFICLCAPFISAYETADIFDFPMGPGLAVGPYYLFNESSPYCKGGERLISVNSRELLKHFSTGRKLNIMVFGIDGMPPANNSVGVGEYHAGEDWRYLGLVPLKETGRYLVNKKNGALEKGIPYFKLHGFRVIEYAYNQPVYAAANGKVVRSFKGGPCWVNVIVIEHTLPEGGRVYSVYEHIKTREVKKGDFVKRGALLGIIGNPTCAGPHLHFEIRNGKRPEDSYDSSLVVAGDGYLPEPNIGSTADHHRIPHQFIYARRAGRLVIEALEAPVGLKFFNKKNFFMLDGNKVRLEFILKEADGRPWKCVKYRFILKDENGGVSIPLLEGGDLTLLSGGAEKIIIEGEIPEGINAGSCYSFVLEARDYQQRGDWYEAAFFSPFL